METQSQTEIRRAVRADFPSIARLQADSWENAYRDFLPASYVRDRMRADIDHSWSRVKTGPGDIRFIAQDRHTGEVVGFISTLCRPTPFIDSLHCSPSRTGEGIGEQLMRATFRVLMDLGHQSVSLTVLVGNEGARRFYLRHGAHTVRRQREVLFGYPVDVDHLEWDGIKCSKLVI